MTSETINNWQYGEKVFDVENHTDDDSIYLIKLNGTDIRRNLTYNDTFQVPFQKPIDIKYIIIPVIFIILCIVAAIINARILISVRWIRRPLSPTLYISLSLALADACIAILFGIGFLLNSLLPIGLNMTQANYCVLLTIEAFRLSGILVSTIHLLALAGNHYLGILSPFRSRRWMTHTNLSIMIAIIWIAPTTYIFAYFSFFQNQGYQIGDCNNEDTYLFMIHQRFRAIYSTLFLIPFFIMFVIYCHISIIVRKHQASRRWFNRHSRRHDMRGARNDEQQQFDRNLKAIWTSLLILSTYMICFMPVVLHFLLVCQDCYFVFNNIDQTIRVITGSIFNFLLITKPLLNPLIYALRMHEIRAATRRMNADCRRMLCLFYNPEENDRTYSTAGDPIHQRFSFVSGSSRRNQCSINSVHLNNGFTRRSTRRRAEDVTTDL